MPDFSNVDLRPYAGIGSRKAPQRVLAIFSCIGVLLSGHGYTLRSGGAPGCDQAFDRYVANNKRKIYVPWQGFEGYPQLYDIPDGAYEIASWHHPTWQGLKPAIQALMARNTLQILGADLRTPSEFVLCWTPDGCEHSFLRSKTTGGTGQAIAVATTYGIPIINFANQNPLGRLAEILRMTEPVLRDSLKSIHLQLFTPT